MLDIWLRIDNTFKQCSTSSNKNYQLLWTVITSGTWNGLLRIHGKSTLQEFVLTI